MDDLVQIGVVGKPHGLKGHVSATIPEIPFELLAALPLMFVEIHGSQVPFRITSVDWLNGQKFRIKFADINDVNAAESLRGANLFQQASKLPENRDENLVGVSVRTADGRSLGNIIEVRDSAMQTLLVIARDGGEVLIPLVEDWIVAYHRKKRELILQLPEGLLEL